MANAAPANAASEQEQDPSMEEILQSIRRIIAEDTDDTKNGVSTALDTTPAESTDVPGSDVLELTDMITEDGSVENIKQQAANDSPPRDVLADIDQALQKPAPPAAPAQPITETPAQPDAAPDDSSLLSSDAAAAASASMKKIISPTAKPQAAATPVPFRSGYTVEDLVLESLKPMLKQWLDDNLPQLVERIVEREIRKLAD